MWGTRWYAVVAMLVAASPVSGQQTELPDTPEGKLVSGFLGAVNASDEEALIRFQEANFSEAALKRRTPEERAARNQQLRQQTGGLTLVEVRSASADQIVLIASGASLPKEVQLVVTFTFTGTPRKIDTVQITSQ
jgi:hypothetical protein